MREGDAGIPGRALGLRVGSAVVHSGLAPPGSAQKEMGLCCLGQRSRWDTVPPPPGLAVGGHDRGPLPARDKNKSLLSNYCGLYPLDPVVRSPCPHGREWTVPGLTASPPGGGRHLQTAWEYVQHLFPSPRIPPLGQPTELGSSCFPCVMASENSNHGRRRALRAARPGLCCVLHRGGLFPLPR